MAAELRSLEERMEVHFAPLTAIYLVGLVQLALRHPGVSSEGAAVARAFLDGAREYFAECPTVLEIIDRGDDPAHDVPWLPTSDVQ
jgi:hypothetical protein